MLPGQLIERMQWRYAVKKFDATKRLAPEIWEALEQALILTPSSFGLQPWRFVVIQDQGLKERLVEHSWGQRQVADCSHHVVFAGLAQPDLQHVDRHIARMSQVTGKSAEDFAGLRKVIAGFMERTHGDFSLQEWAVRQVYIALGNLMTSAAMLGVDVCPMEGINASKYDEVLDLPSQGFRTVVCAAVGYRSADDKYAASPKVRFLREAVIEHR